MTDKYIKRARREAEAIARQQDRVRMDRSQIKAEKRLAKVQARIEKAEAAQQEVIIPEPVTGEINVACVIHGDAYSWDYVDRLYNMVSRNLTADVKFHVYTEADRQVPDNMIKHDLVEWDNISGPRKAWWYKMQIFNPAQYSGPLLYFDLDVIIVKNIDWIPALTTKYFWAPRDFRQFWRPTHRGINSSVMWFDTERFAWIWNEFQQRNIIHLSKIHHGDQDYISELLNERYLRYFEPMKTASWRWQCLDGGMDFRTRKYLNPNSGTSIDHRTSILIFHGSPKPHELPNDPVVTNFWM